MLEVSISVKKIVFRIAAGFLVCAALILGVQCYLMFAINSDILKTKISDFFSGNLGKAVKYDSANVWFFGGITLKNFYLSRNDDFNDNLSLLRCDTLYLGLSLKDLIRKSIVIRKVSVDNAEINISKQYADTHQMFWKTLLSPQKKNASDNRGFVLSGLKFSVSNSRILYREIFENEIVQVSLTGFESDIVVLKDGRIEYSASGSVEPHQGNKGSSSFTIDGNYNDTLSDVRGKLNFSIKYFDLSYLNPYISMLAENKTSISGHGQVDIHSLFVNDSCSFSGKIAIEDCSARINRGTQDEPIMVNSSFASSFSIDVVEGKKYHIRDCNIYDGNVDLSLSGIYERSESDETASLSYILDPCDIDKLISSYRFARNISLDGTLSSSGFIYLDNTRSITDCVNASLKIKNFEMKGSSERSWLGKMKGDINADVLTESARFRANGFVSDSPLTVSIDSFVENYLHLTSDSFCSIESDGMKSEFLEKFLTVGLNNFFSRIYADRRKGYEDIKFLGTSAGTFINSNDLSVEISFPELFIGKAKLTKISADAILKKGVLKGELVSAEGFGAKYSASAEGFFNSDFPRIELKSSVDNFDLGSFSSSAGIPGIKSGILSASLQYTMNGNRLAHFIDNGVFESSVMVSNLNADTSGYISNFEDYLKTRGYIVTFLPLSVQSGKIEYRQTGEVGAFTIMSLVSDRFRAEGYGRYTYNDGINASGTLTTIAKDPQTQSVYFPYKITGAFGAPVFKVDVKGKPSDGFILY